MNEKAIQKSSAAQGAVVQSENIYGSHLATTQTQATVLAARAKAEVEARFMVAIHRPRSLDKVRQDIKAEIELPGFADGKFRPAWYSKPVGGGKFIEGFSIGFAEAAKRCMTNMDARSTVIYEDEFERVVIVEVIDMESNTCESVTIPIKKTVERKFLKKGEVEISRRENSQGETTYLRAATDDEMLQKQNSAVSKAKRNGILSMVPGSIQNECRQRILEIRHGDDIKDPTKFARQTVDAFKEIGVSVKSIEEFIGHEISACSPGQIGGLRDIYKSIKNNDTTWADVTKKKKDKGPKNLDELTADMKEETEGDDLGYGKE